MAMDPLKQQILKLLQDKVRRMNGVRFTSSTTTEVTPSIIEVMEPFDGLVMQFRVRTLHGPRYFIVRLSEALV